MKAGEGDEGRGVRSGDDPREKYLQNVFQTPRTRIKTSQKHL